MTEVVGMMEVEGMTEVVGMGEVDFRYGKSAATNETELPVATVQ